MFKNKGLSGLDSELIEVVYAVEVSPLRIIPAQEGASKALTATMGGASVAGRACNSLWKNDNYAGMVRAGRLVRRAWIGSDFSPRVASQAGEFNRSCNGRFACGRTRMVPQPARKPSHREDHYKSGRIGWYLQIEIDGGVY